MFWEKFISLNAYSRKEEQAKRNNLSSQFKDLKKEEYYSKPKISARKEII